MNRFLISHALGFVLVIVLFCCPFALAEGTAGPEATPVSKTVTETEALSVEEELDRLEEELFGPVVETAAGCTAEATCDDGTTISCSTSDSSVTCQAQDQDCEAEPDQPGYVTCGLQEQFCDACPLDCNGAPPISKCIPDHSCIPGCGHCGPGTCFNGRCNCFLI